MGGGDDTPPCLTPYTRLQNLAFDHPLNAGDRDRKPLLNYSQKVNRSISIH